MLNARLHLTLPVPPSDNAAHKSAPGLGIVRSDAAKQFYASVARLMSLSGKQPLKGLLHVEQLHVYFPRAGCDLGNRLKVLNDALNGWAWLDDLQIEAIDNFRRRIDRNNPRVELVVAGEAFATAEEARLNRQLRKAREAKRKQGAAKARATKRKKKLEALQARFASRATSATHSARGT